MSVENQETHAGSEELKNRLCYDFYGFEPNDEQREEWLKNYKDFFESFVGKHGDLVDSYAKSAEGEEKEEVFKKAEKAFYEVATFPKEHIING